MVQSEGIDAKNTNYYSGGDWLFLVAYFSQGMGIHPHLQSPTGLFVVLIPADDGCFSIFFHIM
jgi:hypothetical protein